jgi:hypothetical protein
MSVSDGPIVECVFSVVGQHREDPDRLLLFGDDGCYYQLDPLEGVPVPVESTEDWVVEFRLAS